MESYKLVIILAIIIIVAGAAAALMFLGKVEVTPQKIYSLANGTVVHTEGTLISVNAKNSIGYIESNGYVLLALGVGEYSVGDKISLSGTYLKSIGVLVSKSDLAGKSSQQISPAVSDDSIFAGRDFGRYVVLKNQKIEQATPNAGILTFKVSGVIGVADLLDVNESSMVVGSMAGYLDLLQDNSVYFRTISLSK